MPGREALNTAQWGWGGGGGRRGEGRAAASLSLSESEIARVCVDDYRAVGIRGRENRMKKKKKTRSMIPMIPCWKLHTCEQVSLRPNNELDTP